MYFAPIVNHLHYHKRSRRKSSSSGSIASNTRPFILAATVEQQGYVQSAFDLSYPFQTEPSAGAAIATGVNSVTDHNILGVRQEEFGIAKSRPATKKRKRPSASSIGSRELGQGQAGEHMTSNDLNVDPATGDAASSSSKPKRVRTGCLTCRERHLKCDEGLPHCLNCRKSSRVCKRGVRLNFIDTQVQSPPILLSSVDWNVSFQDESREIASEYKGGLGKYAVLSPDLDADQVDPSLNFEFPVTAPPAPSLSHQPLPPIQGILPETYEDPPNIIFEPPRESHHQHTHSTTDSTYSTNTMQGTAYSTTDNGIGTEDERREYLNSQEEVLFMQVFVEEVGLWMDSMDPMKHFSRLLPFHSLREPMLLNAFLACGARHLTLVNPAYHEDKALNYYDTATRWLLKSLQNPNRDTVICATTAVILNVYEIMSERALQRMNHIAGARALIKECGWNARSTGIGAACFWLNVGMELLSCLHFNWQVAWDPDEWGIDMDFTREQENGKEELWTYRMVYIVAKICNFRASIPRFAESSPRDEQIRLQKRYEQWTRLKQMADSWNDNIPRTMHPMAYLYPYQTTSKSAFPEVWLIKRTTIISRLFYHTAMVLLAQTNPIMSAAMDEMSELQKQHANLICGIVAHVKDRGVASVALRSLAIAAEALTVRREQEEVLQIFEKISKETGWRIGFVFKELKEKWDWDEVRPQPLPPQPMQMANAGMLQSTTQLQPFQYQTTPNTSQPMAAMQPTPPTGSGFGGRPPSGILNPVLATADFSMPKHPYQNIYVAPNSLPSQTHFNY
ncbi:MAG: hypothetical protein M1820_009963 [Bogoriella megaspora]|nr:MAG: hypothetical protein M1820_009963 [Bogoriella megaspora]